MTLLETMVATAMFCRGTNSDKVSPEEFKATTSVLTYIAGRLHAKGIPGHPAEVTARWLPAYIKMLFEYQNLN